MVALHPTIHQEVLNETAAIDAANTTAAEESAARAIGREPYLAVAFLLGADRTRYGMLIEEIEN